MILYVNGCSWSSLSNATLTGKTYGDYLAEKLKATVINHASPGASNSKIFRSTVRNLQELIKTKKDIICVLNVSVLRRADLWDTERKLRTAMKKQPGLEPKVVELLDNVNDGEYVSFSHHRSLDLINQFADYSAALQSYVLNCQYEQAVYDLYYELFMLITYFKQHNIKYLIFSGTTMDKELESLDYTLEWISEFRNPVINDPAVLDFDKINFCHWAYDNGYEFFDENKWPTDHTGRPYGHPDTKAHDAWADFLYNKLNELYGPL